MRLAGAMVLLELVNRIHSVFSQVASEGPDCSSENDVGLATLQLQKQDKRGDLKALVEPPPAVKCVGDCTYCTPHGEIDDGNVFNDMPLCADGEYQWACQSQGRGPRVKCPAVAPIMCAYKRCDGDMDYCCETDCGAAGSEPFGGPRLCKSNLCEATKPDLPKIDCTGDVGEQAGTKVTAGYQGSFRTNAQPIKTTFSEAGLCPVNVHWHAGTEHASEGQYDAGGKGPEEHEDESYGRRGFRCHLYNHSNSVFTTEYNWKHCKHMKVGETYEVHWPHSKGGACDTPFQYQTPFLDGVFCHGEKIKDTAGDIGVQAQVFTVVNDEAYFYPDLIKGMRAHGDYGKDIGYYTGSTTGTSVNNEICSPYSPITWQVDRMCHLISASSFDKLCEDMTAQMDDLSEDMHPHGSRHLVTDKLAANNHQL